jgi:two-component system, sensor histidine kinase and response regulator
MIKDKVKALFEYLLIDKKNSSLENRLFLSSIVFGISISLTGAIVIYFIGKTFTSVTFFALGLTLVLSIGYYFVRFKGIIKPFVIPFIVIINGGFAISWLMVGGINGSNIILGMVVLILGLIIVQPASRKYILIVFILLLIGLYLIQFYRPELIPDFTDPTSRWIDSLSTAIYSSFFIFLIVKFLLNQYSIERSKAEENGEKLLQLNDDKDRFISILSHDLKSPFNTLVGFSNVLKEDVRKLSIDQIEEIAVDINKSARTTYNLLEEILVWARAQQGKFPFNPQRVNLLSVCDYVVEIHQPNANSKGIDLKCSVHDGIFITADSDMLKTVLRNLVSNAIKFTNDKGTILINAVRNSEHVIISVSEDGVGIKPDNLSKLFNISQVLSTPGTANESGTGLGLLLCKEFVEKHGGRIWAESEFGKGSKFSFTIPLIEKTGN